MHLDYVEFGRGASCTCPAPGRPAAGDSGDEVAIDAILLDLAAKQRRLSAFIDDLLDSGGADPREIGRLLALHGQNAARLGRLLRDRQALGGTLSGDLQAALDRALDELSEEWGVEL
jgi:hypothetical protein